MSERDLEVGDWVRIWAQVEASDNLHPEDVRLRAQSHNADEYIVVRRDRVKYNSKRPEWAPICTALYSANGHVLVRCARSGGHSGNHFTPHGNTGWSDDETHGYMETR